MMNTVIAIMLVATTILAILWVALTGIGAFVGIWLIVTGKLPTAPGFKRKPGKPPTKSPDYERQGPNVPKPKVPPRTPSDRREIG